MSVEADVFGDDTRMKDLLPDRCGAGAQAEARRLLWAMQDLLPWQVSRPRACRRVFRDAAEFAAEWEAQGGDLAELPQVDFTKSMVVAVIEDAGEYREAHSIARVVATGGEVVVGVGTFSRPWQMINPSAVIRVPRQEGHVRFVDAGSPEATPFETIA